MPSPHPIRLARPADLGRWANQTLKILLISAISLLSSLMAVEDMWKGVTVTKYDISGKSISEIRDSISVVGPKNNGKRFAPPTKWNVSVKYPFGTGRARVELAINAVLPAIDNGKMNQDLLNRWERFYADLLRHEERHIEIARMCRAEIEKTINAYSSERHEKVASDIIDKWKARERDMDQETDHGKTEGVEF